MDLDAIADELYGVPPEEFTALRKQRAADARAAGDRDLAKQVLALRRPTRSAWIVNLLADQAADDLAGLLELGAALAEAQQRLSGADLRRLSGQRHAAIAALVKRGEQLAEIRGHSAADATLREVSGTLQAALSDPGIADQVRAGHLSQALEYSGFGPELTFGPDLTLGTELRSRSAPVEDRAAADTPSNAADDHGDQDTVEEDDEAAHDRLIEQLNAAQSTLDRVRVQVERVAGRVDKAADVATKRRTRVEELRDQLQRAEREASSAADELEQESNSLGELRAAEQTAEDAVSAALAALADG